MATKKEVSGSYLKKADIPPGEHRDVVIKAVRIEHFDANKYGPARDAEVITFDKTSTAWVPNNTSWNQLIDLLGDDERLWAGKTIRIQRGVPDSSDLPDGLYCALELPPQKPTDIVPEPEGAGAPVASADPFS